ncbi:hypothetical protein [Ottowia sp.]|uniref:hypothetical protein n=1 Tax=Ottowia sp. TaxID=1898956 RepID=UPI00261A2CBB|nr:hypothetical protein [Ottowia sp.]
MFASIATRSVARTCVLLGGTGHGRPPTVQKRPLAALLRPLPSPSGLAGDAEESRRAGS